MASGRPTDYLLWHPLARSEFVRTVADSDHLRRADDPAPDDTERHRPA